MSKLKKTALCFLRNDLRLHDNEVIYQAIEKYENVLLIFCFDIRQFEKLNQKTVLNKKTYQNSKRNSELNKDLNLNFRKTDAKRVQFLLETVNDLRKNLKKISSNIILKIEKPEEVIPNFIEEFNQNKETKYKIIEIFAQSEPTYEEIIIEEKLKQELIKRELKVGKKQIELTLIWGKTLYHIEDSPFPPSETPQVSKEFRIELTKKTEVRQLIKMPSEIDLPQHIDFSDDNFFGKLPTFQELGFEEAELEHLETIAFQGGESAALQRLNYYTFESELLTGYKFTRNRSLGKDYSSKLSPYLAVGSLSPRKIYWTVREYESKIKKNISTWWLVFEVVWRDFFYFQSIKHGNQIFKIEGIKNKKEQAKEFIEDYELFEKWTNGQTGVPFVDAHMRELLQTGFMSNRGRVNCASFLTRNYKIDWRWGAAWFESHLLDYDTCSNWLNWNTQALDIYYTNPIWQGLKYDKKAEYIKTWIPELDIKLDDKLKDEVPVLLHAPWLLENPPKNYIQPAEIYDTWKWATGRLKNAYKKQLDKQAGIEVKEDEPKKRRKKTKTKTKEQSTTKQNEK